MDFFQEYLFKISGIILASSCLTRVIFGLILAKKNLPFSMLCSKTSARFILFDFIKPSKAIAGASTLGPLMVIPFFSIFSGIPSKKKTNLFGVE